MNFLTHNLIITQEHGIVKRKSVKLKPVFDKLREMIRLKLPAGTRQPGCFMAARAFKPLRHNNLQCRQNVRLAAGRSPIPH